MDKDWRIIGLINNYSRISFNFGPTLLYWLARYKPAVYESILQADKESINNFGGHGSAMAQVYNHMIMPLANRKDKETQVKWAIRDFQYRFQRDPEGMWLPETAVDVESLEVMAENNIKFTILSPHQASKMRKRGDQKWIDVSHGNIDPRQAYLCNLPSGKSITLFFYDKQTASDIAFGNLLQSGEAFAKRLVEAFNDNRNENLLESVASDGELYGHHHPHGDMTLAYCIYYIVSNDLAKLTNFAEFLSKFPPDFEVDIQENTSWSCIHGVERWRSDCGDNMGHPGWNQAWRRPLREAMDWLRDTLLPLYQNAASIYLKDPWEARNHYIDVILDRSGENVDAFLAKQAKKELPEVEKRRVLKLLEMQRYAMLMFTSCGWFFDEISGIETVQVMTYAARVMQLAHDVFQINLEENYLRILEKADSNIPEFGNGAKVYSIFVKPAIVDFPKISAQQTIVELFSNQIKAGILTAKKPNCCFKVTSSNLRKLDDGKFRLLVSRSNVFSATTLDDDDFGCAAVWLGDHNVSCGVLHSMPEEAFNTMKEEMVSLFEKGQINELIVSLSKYFGQNIYSLKDLFKDDQRNILNHILAGGLATAKDLFSIVLHNNAAMLRFMKQIRIPPPKPLSSAAEIAVNMQFAELFSAKTLDLQKIERIMAEYKSLPIALDSQRVAFMGSERIAREFSKLLENPDDVELISKVNRLIGMLNQLPISLDLWQAQNDAFKIAQSHYQKKKNAADEASKAWVAAFKELCGLIGVRLD